VLWAIADHPWVDDADGAAVRVAMTVIAKDPRTASLVKVDDQAHVIGKVSVVSLNSDLSSHADVPRASAVPLQAANGLSSQGVKVGGKGFVLSESKARELIAAEPRNAEVVHPFRNGRDLSARPRGVWIIDLGLRDENAARSYPLIYDWLRDRVQPERAANARESYRRLWWRFLEPRRELREALAGLPRYIATLEVSKHRFFTFLDSTIVADGTLVCIATADAYHLGVLSSRIHVAWALAAGGRMGVGNDPRYTKKLCFDAFPFPTPSSELRASIASAAESIDKFRKQALSRDELVTITALYNVVEKREANEELTESEGRVNELGGCGVLADLHRQLDALVAQAYGLPWPLQDAEVLGHLVALHDERANESPKKRGA
jgi:hypothetical protein